MGGKHKAQRTKNNVRPSSSGRSAELLGSNVSSFVGFSSIKVGGYVPALPGSSDEIDSNINPNFHLVLKKMNKKDSTTKLKALNEFASLCRESDPTAVKTVLPFWPRLYCVLATDTEHRVREGAHNAHKAVVSSVGRSIAPYLKQIAGAWFTSQYDTYPPAASAASSSFQEAFSPNKLLEAIIFCQEEILNYITDNLINQTPQTLSNPKTTTVEEMESKYQRVIVSSLHGYGFYLNKLPQEQLIKADQLNKKLIENSKFFKFSKRPESVVRVAWFTAVVNLCQKAAFFLSNIKKQLIMAVFNNLDDPDSGVLPVVWEAALHILVTIPDWSNHISGEKLLLPKLWKILKEGGSGCASSIFPNILPFLTKLPYHLIPDKHLFYSHFFSSFHDGIKQRSVQTSIVECESVAECYVECFSFITLSNIEEEMELCNRLVFEQLLPLIELTLKDNKMHLFRRPFFDKLVAMLVQWSGQQKTPEMFFKLVRDVFYKMAVMCCKIIDECSFDKNKMEMMLCAQADLISAFKYLHMQNRKKRLKVTFSDSEDKSPLVSKNSNKSAESFFESTPIGFQFEANNFVKKMMEKYFNSLSVINMCRKCLVSQLAKVVAIFDSNDTYNFLLMLSVGHERSWNEFFNEYITVWLSDEEILVDDVSRLIFTLLKYVQSEDDRQLVLHSLSQSETKNVLLWCLKDENMNFSSVKNWLSSDKIDSIIISVVQEAIVPQTNEDDTAYLIVKSCFKTTRDGSILIKQETVLSILKFLCETLKTYQSKKDSNLINIDIVARLINCGLIILDEHLDARCMQYIIDIVSECFKFCLNRTNCSQNPIINQTWQQCINKIVMLENSNSPTLIRKLTDTCSAMVNQCINDICNLITVDEIRHVVEQCVKYLITSEKNDNSNDNRDEFIDKLLKLSLLQMETVQYANYVFKLCYCTQVINGKLSLPLFQEISGEIDVFNFSEIFSSADIIKQFITPSLFTILFLTKLFGIDETYLFNDVLLTNKGVCANYEEDYCDGTRSSDQSSEICLKIIEPDNYTFYIADCLLKVAASTIIHDNFNKCKQYFEFGDKMKIMERCTKELIQTLGNDVIINVQRDLIKRGLNGLTGGICAEALSVLVIDFLGKEMPNPVEDIQLNEVIDENKLTYSLQRDVLSNCLHQVFSCVDHFNTFDDCPNKLQLVCCLLRKPNLIKEEIIVKDTVNWLLEYIFRLGKLTTFEADLSSCSTEDIQFSGNVAELLSIIIKNSPDAITDNSGWDFTMIATASWISNLGRSIASSCDKNHLSSLPVLHLLSSVCRLFESMSSHLVSLPLSSTNEESDSDMTLTRLKAEWNDVFKLDLHKTLINIWADIAENCVSHAMGPLMVIICHQLAVIIDEIIDMSVFITKAELSYWLEICCHRMQSSIVDIQLASFNLLSKLTPYLVDSDSDDDEGNKSKAVVNNVFSFKHIQDSFRHVQSIVDTMLSGFKLGDTCIVEPFTDGYIYTTSYLFLWLFILDVCDKADSQLRFMYTAWIKENNFLEYLMKTLFCLMPEEAVHSHEGNINKSVQELFSNPPQFSSVVWDSKTLAHLSCWTYYKLLARLPAEVRQWWSEIDHKVATIVERLTATFVSSLLCASELKAVRHESNAFQNVTVRVHPAAREVVATYVVEESSTELVIQLPLNHPLGPTKVECGKCMVSTNQTRTWIMQLSLFLTHQNGSIRDALSLWKTLIDKKFEGVEECYICFAILHNTTQQLPRLTCQTCKKKFHNTCLYQWFTTSNKSTCPICRNLF